MSAGHKALRTMMLTGVVLAAGLWLAPSLVAQTMTNPTAAARAQKLPAKAEQMRPSLPTKQAVTKLGRLPLYFEANRGQTDARVKFLSRGRGYTLFLTKDEAVLALKKKPSAISTQPSAEEQKRRVVRSELRAPGHAVSSEAAVLRMHLNGAQKNSMIEGIEPLPGKVYYASGNETGPLEGNATYKRVKYGGVYPGIDLEYYGDDSRMEFDFVVAPHADPGQIHLSFSGAEEIKLSKHGDLSLRVSGEEIRLKEPHIYQNRNGDRVEISGGYVLTGKDKREASFKLASYDPSLPLVIDPVIEVATYLGTSSWEQITSVFLNAAGEVYVLGNTGDQVNFPQTGNLGAGFQGCFISKFDATLSTLLSSIILGNFNCYASDVGPAGIYLVGSASAPNFGLFASLRIVNEQPNGTVSMITRPDSLQLGPAKFVQVDSAGNVYILGQISDIYRDPSLIGTGLYTFLCPPPSSCPNLVPPLPNGFLTTPMRTQFNYALLKYDAQGTLVYGTNIYGTTFPAGNWNFTWATGLDIDNTGHAYVVGITGATDFPTTAANARNPQFLQNWNCTFFTSNGLCHLSFLMQIDTTQSGAVSLAYSSFLDEISTDGSFWNSVTVDPAGAVYVAGTTGGFWGWGPNPSFLDPFMLLTPKDFALGGGYTNDGQGLFVTKMNLSLPPAQQVLFTSTFGGGGNIRNAGVAISLRATGEILVYGHYENEPCVTFSGSVLPVCLPFVFLNPAMPPPPDPQQGEFLTVSFLAELSSTGTQLLSSTPLGTETQCCQASELRVALTASGDFFVGMDTTETGRAAANAYQTSIAGDRDILLFSLVRAPVADPQTVATDMDQPIDIVLTGSDPQGDTLTFAVATQPANGVLCCPGTEPNVNYTPNPGFTGTDTFTFTVSDGRSTSAPATVTIKVRGTVDLWVRSQAFDTSAVAITSVQVDSPFYVVAAIDNYGPSDANNVTLSGLDTLGAFTIQQILPSQGTCTGSPGASFQCAFGTLPAGAYLSVWILVTPTQAVFPSPNVNSVDVDLPVSGTTDDNDADPTNNASSSVITVVRQATQNNAPAANAGPDQTVTATSAAGAAVTLDGSASMDPDGDTLTFTWTGPFGTLNGVSIQPTLAVGTHTITLTVDDGRGGTSSDTVVVTVSPPQDITPPVVTAPPVLTLAATETAGARGNVSPSLHAFLLAGSATDAVDPNPQRLPPQVNGSDVDDTTLFPVGATSVTFRFHDADNNIGVATSQVIVLPPVGGAADVGGVPVTPTDAFNTLIPSLEVTFAGIVQPGLVTAQPIVPPPAAPAGFQFLNVVFDISTTALFMPPITVCFSGSGFTPLDRLLHYQGGSWVDVTSFYSPTKVCGTVTSLSPFGVATPLNHPPSASVQANQTIEATSAAGANVSLSGSGTDPDGDALTFAWSGPCGSAATAFATFTCPLGTSTMTLTVSDGRGGTATAGVQITVQDTTPPVLTLPANITAIAASASGATVNYSVSAMDLVSGSVVASCLPASGATFSLGTTTVNCTATDTHTNSAGGGFSVTVSVGTPRLSGAIVAKGRDAAGNYYVDLRLKNTGTGHARNVRIATLSFRTLSGNGLVTYDATLSGVLPLTVGALDLGAATTVRLYLNVPSTVTRFSITEGGKLQDVVGSSFSFSLAQSVIP